MVEGRSRECSSQRLLHYARTRGNDLEKNYEVSLYSFRFARLGTWGCPEYPRPRPMNLAGIACAELIRSDWDFPEEPHLRGSEALRFIQHETGAAAPASPTVQDTRDVTFRLPQLVGLRLDQRLFT